MPARARTVTPGFSGGTKSWGVGQSAMMLSRRAFLLLVAASVGSEMGVSVGVGGKEGFDCCLQPYAFFDCTGAGHEVSPGKLYTCVQTSAMTGCMTCLGTVDYSNGTCSTCCSDGADSECAMLESDWEFYASTLFFVCLCCCFTALCGYTEVRRKKKGISFAEAWSVPQAMPILRTWPGRSLSSSDMMPGQGGDEQHWAQLSDSEEDLKKYPVAGLVDDSGVTFGFVASMPQSLLSSLAPPMRHPDSTRDPPPGSQTEPELTIRIPRARGAGAAAVEAGDAAEAAVATRAEGYGGTEEAGRLPRGGGQTSAAAAAAAAAAAVGNNLQEPLMFGDGTAPSRRDVGVARGGSASGGVVREGVDVAEGGRYR